MQEIDEASIEEALKRIAHLNGYYDVVLDEITFSGLASSPSLWSLAFAMHNLADEHDKSLVNKFMPTGVCSSSTATSASVVFAGAPVVNVYVYVHEKRWTAVKSKLEELSSNGYSIIVFGFKEPLMMPHETFEEAVIRHDLHT